MTKPLRMAMLTPLTYLDHAVVVQPGLAAVARIVLPDCAVDHEFVLVAGFLQRETGDERAFLVGAVHLLLCRFPVVEATRQVHRFGRLRRAILEGDFVLPIALW